MSVMRANLVYLFFTAICIISAFDLKAQCGATGITYAPDPILLCEGDSVTITFTATGTCTGVYEFQVMDGATVVQPWSNSPIFIASPTDSTNYTIQARCSACPLTVISQTCIVDVVKEPVITGNLTVCSGSTTTLTATGSNSTIKWYDNQTGGNLLSSNGTFTTPPLSNSITIWAQAYSSTSSSTVGSVLITECGLDGANGGTTSEDYIEISNLYNTAVNTSGWVVAISNSYTNINVVNSTYWYLPTSFAPCSIVTKTDVSSAPNYWGSNIFWNPPNNSWAIIIDNFGNVVDFIAWGWTSADLATFNPTINGFNITLGPQWIGNGCPLPCASTPSVQYSFARNGSADNNNASDFFCQPTSVNLLNPGLTCGWSASASCPYPAPITVIPKPAVNDIQDQSACGYYVLPTITGTNLSGNQAFYTGSGGTGISYQVGDTIFSTTTLYIFDSTSTSPSCDDEESFLVTITPNTLMVNAGPDQSVCAGESVTLTASGASSLTWNNSVVNGVSFVQPVGSVTYTVTGVTGMCTQTDQVVVTVNPKPIISVMGDTTLCEGESLVLTASGAGLGGNYSWNNGISNAVSFVPPVGNTKYVVTGTDANGCVNSDSLIVTVIPTPIVDFNVDNQGGCAPLVVNFSNSSTGNLTNCTWTINNGSSFNSCSSFSDTLYQIGCYDVTLTVSTMEGCSNSLTKPGFVCVYPEPTAAFYITPEQVNSQEPVATMVNQSSDATNYVWDFGDGTGNSNEFSPAHNFPSQTTANYTVTLIAFNDYGCSDTTTRKVLMEEALIYYVPNSFTPDGDEYNQVFVPIFTSGFDPYNYSFLIYNRWGELIFESNNHLVGWDGSYHGKIAKEGVYTWKITFKIFGQDNRKVLHGSVNLIR